MWRKWILSESHGNSISKWRSGLFWEIFYFSRIKITGIDKEALRIEPCPGAFENLPSGVIAHAPLFDVTPADYICRTISELGELTRELTRELSVETARLRSEVTRAV